MTEKIIKFSESLPKGFTFRFRLVRKRNLVSIVCIQLSYKYWNSPVYKKNISLSEYKEREEDIVTEMEDFVQNF